MSGAANVLVVTEAGRGLSGTGREALALGRSLADSLGGRVDVLAFGAVAAALAGDVGAAGGDRIAVAEAAAGDGYHPAAFAALVISACGEWGTRFVLFAHDALGLDLAPRVAFGLGVRWATNCTGARLEGAALLCQRNEVGGKVRVVESIDGGAVLTLRPTSIDVPPPQAGRQAALVALSPAAPPAPDGVTFVARQRGQGVAADELAKASIIVSGGMGMGSTEAFACLRALADALGGALGGSKQAVDRGWLPADRQIGLTGTTVAPKVYLAVALSGALQHMAGCQKSKIIVAINSDAEAPIFRFARYGVVAKWEEIVPELLERLA